MIILSHRDLIYCLSVLFWAQISKCKKFEREMNDNNEQQHGCLCGESVKYSVLLAANTSGIQGQKLNFCLCFILTVTKVHAEINLAHDDGDLAPPHPPPSRTDERL